MRRLAAAILLLALAAGSVGAASPRTQLTRETHQLRNTLLRSPTVRDARQEVADATIAFHAERRRIREQLQNEPEYGRAKRALWRAEREFQEALTWAPPFNEWRFNSATRLMLARHALTQMEVALLKNDPAYAAAKQRRLDARLAYAAAIEEVDRRVRDDGRLQRLRGALASR